MRYVEWIMIGAIGVMVGCANHRGSTLSSASASGPALKSATTNSSESTAFSGSWLCMDAQCAEDTVKTISEKSGTLETEWTERLTSQSPASICRIKELEQLRLSGTQGKLVHSPLELVDSAENTRDCSETLSKLNEISPEPIDIAIAAENDGSSITINGVRYRKLSDTELSTIRARHSALNSRYPTVAGTWSCVEDGCGDIQQTIASDLKTLTTESTIEFAAADQKCLLKEVSKIEITDSTEPNRIYANRTHGAIALVDSPENTGKCGQIVQQINQEKGVDGVGTDQIAIERDGNQEIVLLGKRYARKE